MKKRHYLKVIVGSFFTTSIVYASGLFQTEVKTFQQMSTQELQQQVEMRSNKGTLPFEMGLELMHRWSKNRV